MPLDDPISARQLVDALDEDWCARHIVGPCLKGDVPDDMEQIVTAALREVPAVRHLCGLLTFTRQTSPEASGYLEGALVALVHVHGRLVEIEQRMDGSPGPIDPDRQRSGTVGRPRGGTDPDRRGGL